MFNIFRFVITILFAITAIGFSSDYSDVKIIQSNDRETIYEYSVQQFKIEKTNIENGLSYQSPVFKNAVFPEDDNLYSVPARILQFIVPQKGDISVEIISSSEKQFENVILKENDINRNNKSTNQSLDVIKLNPKMRFRDMMNRSVQINPVRYNHNSRTIVLFDKIRFKVTYSGVQEKSNSFKKSGRLDNIYQDYFINFAQSKNWQIKKATKFYKPTTLSNGTYYEFEIEKDGIYKINASTLQNIGVDTDALNINSIQLHNNGGHMLSFATIAEQYNPEYTQEAAILIFDQNNNNLFDANDYLLFYGKSINGWYYDYSRKEFVHHTHDYDTKNKYYLSVSGTSGKRISYNPLPDISSQITQDYFIEKFHYERDLYNILTSGPDWYGHRFYGTSGSHSVDFNLDYKNSTGITPQIEIQMKGGSGVHYLDNDYYKYTFNITLNESPINYPSFTSSGRISRTFTLNDSYLKNGQNNLDFIYSSNSEESNVYLDYFSILYPKALAADNKYLKFYTESNDQNIGYTLSGFNGNNIYLLDVTDPLNPELHLQNETVSGNLVVDVAAGSDGKELIAFDLSSSKIKAVSKLKPYIPENNLLDVNKSADFIVITSKSLLPYGNEIAEIRDHLKTEVVSVEDIYFYFNSGVADPTAIRNFIRYAYYNWQTPSLSYVLLFGDGHYDYRNIILTDSIIVPTFQIYSSIEYPRARESDQFFGQIDNNDNSESQSLIKPSVAMGRLPVENALDAERVVEKLKNYKLNPIKDGWQTNITFLADDNIVSLTNTGEWLHQRQADELSRLTSLQKYNINKIYLSAYKSIPGGRRFIKPEATNALIDQINRGTLILNYTGHGSPTQWAHETAFNFDRDYSKINNENRLPFIVAATCDFGLFDDPNRVSFSEALIWKENAGCIGILAATRLVEANQNHTFVQVFYSQLFPSTGPSIELGQAFMSSINLNAGSSNINDQKYHLFADPSMTLADGREEIEIISDFPDTLKALSEVTIKGNVKINGQASTNFNGGAVIIVNDAEYEDVNTGGGEFYNYTLKGPLIFRGEISVESGNLEGKFIVPKTIRYNNKNSGRVTFYAWDESTNLTAMGYNNNLLFSGSSSRNQENQGPELDIYFEDQENFQSGDMISANPILIAKLSDESGINITGQLGHKIELRINDEEIIDISQSFTYNRDSYKEGMIHYPITSLSAGDHTLALQAYDNLNNRTEETINFSITESSGIDLDDVINYPNPFTRNTSFTFQTNEEAAEVIVKIYTIAGRLIETLEGYTTVRGYNEIEWNGHDRDGNILANGVYLYKIILKKDGKSKNKIEKMVVLK